MPYAYPRKSGRVLFSLWSEWNFSYRVTYRRRIDFKKPVLKAHAVLHALKTVTDRHSAVYNNPYAVAQLFNQTENMFLTTMYVHEQVYPEICKKHGYEMRRYPEIFRRIFSAERSRIEQTLKSRDISPTEFWNQIPEKYRTKIFARLEQTMLEISRETKAQTF